MQFLEDNSFQNLKSGFIIEFTDRVQIFH